MAFATTTPTNQITYAGEGKPPYASNPNTKSPPGSNTIPTQIGTNPNSSDPNNIWNRIHGVAPHSPGVSAGPPNPDDPLDVYPGRAPLPPNLVSGNPATVSNEPWLTKTLSEENPLPWQIYLPGQTVSSADQMLARGADPNAMNEMLKYGTGNINAAAPGLMGSNKASPMSAAIQEQTSRNLGTKLQGMQNQAGQQAVTLKQQQLAAASDIYGKQFQVEMQNFKEQYAFQQQRQQAYNAYLNAQNQAKSQFLGQALGTIPFVGGALAAGATKGTNQPTAPNSTDVGGA